MATSVDDIVSPWLCVRPPECRAEVSSLEARRMLAKLGELHRPVHSRLRRIQVQHGAVHAMTGLARRGLIWCWRSLRYTGGGRRWSWFHLGSCESTLAKDGTPQKPSGAILEVAMWQPRPSRRWTAPKRS
jgi:hypothetical protein